MLTDQEALRLHDRATRGEILSGEQQAQLDTWYAQQDRLEFQTPGLNNQERDIETLHARVDEALRQLHTMTARMQTIAFENDTLRQEIVFLRRQLSQRTQFQAVRWTISHDLREHIREYANFACEFCGVSEEDTGVQLTIDHYRPKSKGGHDEFENLLYCCVRCNQYKMDYWPEQPDDVLLWNPRQEPFSDHFLELDDGTLHPLTPVGAFHPDASSFESPALWSLIASADSNMSVKFDY